MPSVENDAIGVNNKHIARGHNPERKPLPISCNVASTKMPTRGNI